MEKYHTAYICENGHVVSIYNDIEDEFCEECGAKVIHTCPKCGNAIRGGSEEGSFDEYKIPRHCRKCGEAYPWTK